MTIRLICNWKKQNDNTAADVVAFSSFFCDLAPQLGCWLAARQMHLVMLHGVLRVPLTFFDTTPTGRIISRFAKDVDVLDTSLPQQISDSIYCLFEVIFPSSLDDDDDDGNDDGADDDNDDAAMLLLMMMMMMMMIFPFVERNERKQFYAACSPILFNEVTKLSESMSNILPSAQNFTHAEKIIIANFYRLCSNQILGRFSPIFW